MISLCCGVVEVLRPFYVLLCSNLQIQYLYGASLQEPWLNASGNLPDKRACQITMLEPVKVKKELQNFASLVKVFGKDSSFVNESGSKDKWHRNVSRAVLEELDRISGWSRDSEEKLFRVAMPSGQTDLLLWDSEPVPLP